MTPTDPTLDEAWTAAPTTAMAGGATGDHGRGRARVPTRPAASARRRRSWPRHRPRRRKANARAGPAGPAPAPHLAPRSWWPSCCWWDWGCRHHRLLVLRRPRRRRIRSHGLAGRNVAEVPRNLGQLLPVEDRPEGRASTTVAPVGRDPRSATRAQPTELLRGVARSRLIVSKGPAPVTVPTNLVGQTLDNATIELRQLRPRGGATWARESSGATRTMPVNGVLAVAPGTAAIVNKGTDVGSRRLPRARAPAPSPTVSSASPADQSGGRAQEARSRRIAIRGIQ